MGRKIGFGFLALFMGSCAMIFLAVPFQSSGNDGVTFFSGVLMALAWGSVALLSVLIVLGKYDPSKYSLGMGCPGFYLRKSRSSRDWVSILPKWFWKSTRRNCMRNAYIFLRSEI